MCVAPSSEPEVSWLAAPFMRPGDPVIHLVRHPRVTVASIVARAFLHEEEPYGRFAYEHAGTFDPWLFWLRWTEMAADVAQATIHLESLAGAGPSLNASPALPTGVEVPSRLRAEVERAARAFGYDLDAPGTLGG